MNLQLCSPYKKCPFNCPMCIAATDEGEVNNVFNLFDHCRLDYYEAVLKAIKDKETVVLTGDTEPTLFTHWITSILKLLKNAEYQGKVELQTKNYKISNVQLELWRTMGLNTVAYSATCAEDLEKILNSKTHLNGYNRLVVLLTDDTLKKLCETSIARFLKFREITFKVLQTPNASEQADYVNEHKNYNADKLNDIIEVLQRYTNISIRIDENCMNSVGRYEIMRIDGKIYQTWF